VRQTKYFSLIRKRGVTVSAYDVVSGPSFRSATEMFNFISECGFQLVDHVPVTSKTLEQTVEDYSNKISSLDIPTDGLVLRLGDIAYGDSLGKTNKFPRNAIAYKWFDDSKVTTLEDIEWNVTKSGIISPVALVKPVEIEGTTVSRASLCNVSELRRLRLGRGDNVQLTKQNKIVPKIVGNLTNSDTYELPEECPCCGSPTDVVQSQVSDTLVLICPNTLCSAKLVIRLSFFASNDGLNIVGLSEKTI